MKRIPNYLIHIICWLAFIIYSHSGYMTRNVDFVDIALNASITLVQIIQFYICFLWVYPNYLKRGKALQLIGGVIVALASFIALRYLIEEVIYFKVWGFKNYADDTTFWRYVSDNVYWGTTYIVVAAAIYAVQENFKSEVAHRKLKDEVAKAELAFLKSQVNPHFLYNTLNYVYSLAIPVSEKLADAVLRLSDLMRYTLTESTTGNVKLTREVAYVENYIALFKMRFEPNFYVQLTTQGVTEGQEIASLVLIPFVENAFKHGVVNDAKHPIKINLRVSPKLLIFEVSNKINRSQKDTSSGVGLINIERRLNLIYPDKHELIISNNGNTYKTTLTIYY